MPGHARSRGKRRDGSTRWEARWRHPDDQAHRRERTFRTRREAERWIAEQESAAIRGAYADPRRGDTLLADLADQLRETWTGLEPKTRAGYEAILTRWLLGNADPLHPGRRCRFATVKVAGVKTADVQRFVNEVGEHRAPNTVRRIYGVLSSLLRLAVQRGYLPANPCDAVRLPTKKRAGVRRSHLYLEGAELRTLAEAMPAHWRLAVYVAGSCGLRAGELWALRRRDVDLLHSELLVRFALKEISSTAASLDGDKGLQVGLPKSAASRRRLKFPTSLAPLLEAHMTATGVRGPAGFAVARQTDDDKCELGYTDDANDPDRLLFVTAAGFPVRHSLFYGRVFRPTVAGASAVPERRVRSGQGYRTEPARPAVPAALPERLHRLRWHDLRHTAAALSLSAPGGNLAMVKERLGHENIATTVDLYGKRVPSVDAALADAVGASIFAEPKPEPAADNVVPLDAAGS